MVTMCTEAVTMQSQLKCLRLKIISNLLADQSFLSKGHKRDQRDVISWKLVEKSFATLHSTEGLYGQPSQYHSNNPQKLYPLSFLTSNGTTENASPQKGISHKALKPKPTEIGWPYFCLFPKTTDPKECKLHKSSLKVLNSSASHLISKRPLPHKW